MNKTIVEKLNLQKYKKVAVLQLPSGANYFEQIDHYDTSLVEETYDLIFAFVFDMDALKALVTEVIEHNYLHKNSYLYCAYPKKGNKVYPTYIHRDDLFEGLGADEDGFIGTSHIKFARMVGLDETFTVVGFKEDSRSKVQASTKASQCVDDYIEMIPFIEKDLEARPELLTFFQSLTPGYQKDWARYVYSAKQESTKTKRREEMRMILGFGFKSVDLYKRNK